MSVSVEKPASPSALHGLAERLGVHREYVAASGEARTVSDQSIRALCEALGFQADSEAAARDSLARLHASRPRLDPVLVVGQTGTLEAAWRGAQAKGEPFEWRITLEDGGTAQGRARLRPASSVHLAAADGQLVLRVPLADIPLGYHQLSVRCEGRTETSQLIVAPPRAYTPPEWESEGRRDWSITTQLYSLRSPRNWGIGDFSDLGELARHAARHGATSIGLNPLHALFAANPHHLSPYSPSSRSFLNPVYLDVEAVPEFAHCTQARSLLASPAFQARLAAARASAFVDYAAVWSLKLQMLGLVFAAFRDEAERRPQGERAQAFEAFKAAAGTALTRLAIFEALQQHFVDQGAGASWHAWPAPMRDPDSPDVAAFAAAHGQAVAFSQFLQWESDRQLGMVAQSMRAHGMTTGLYRDVAVGVDPNGAEAWGDQALLVSGASVGAPPDIYNPGGQDWGLTPLNPIALQQRAYAPFVAAIRANMQHAGAVRIDHVLGLQRLFWVPSGMAAGAGGYVSYPYAHLMAIVALESQRQKCLVVGEDLGTVPEGFREDAERRGVLSYRVLMFEREDGDGPFLPPSHYPKLAAATVSTHDLPTLAGLWSGRDLEWRRELGLYADDDGATRELQFRSATRTALIEALIAQGDLSQGAGDRLLGADPTKEASITDLAVAAHRYLAKAPSRLLLVQLEDLAGEIEQMNLPGTVDQHPNWRRKLQRPLDQLFRDPAVIRIANAISENRAA